MSIRLLQSIFIAGVLSPVDGSTLSLSPALEADLVNQGKAAWVAAPELTASELAHASAHARMRQPNGVPIILAQSAIPMILPSSGTMGANGALTGLTALPYSAFPQPCFMYFPAGKVFSGSPAGMYYAILTSATAATVYNNRYTSGLPQDAIPGVLTPVVDAGPGAYTQTTGSLISLATITIPGGVMGPHGLFAMDYWTTQSNNANAKVGNTSFDGSGGSTSAPTSTAGNKYEFRIHNRGSVSSQVMSGSAGACSSTGPNMSVYPAVNTAADKTVAIQVQMTTVATDYMILESFTAAIYPG
jgi:hypothetical protein